MKKKLLLIIYLFLSLFMHIALADETGVAIVKKAALNGSNTIIASESITFQPGFTYVANSTSVLNAKIDQSQVFEKDNYLTTVISAPTVAATNGPVGSSSGSIDVSPTGGLTYSIPIFSSPGTAGIQPSISISYNSQMGNGLLGIGWDIAGLSAISRVGRTFYQDGVSKGVNLDDEDVFSMDGNRLLFKTLTSEGTEYETETKTFSIIKAFEIAGSGTQFFIVKTKDGKTIEYGNSDDSRVFAKQADGTNSSAAYLFRINRITDMNGNYMTFSYRNLNGESAIDRIDYTGNSNAGTNTYNSLQFYYDKKSDANTIYIAGNSIDQALLLRKICAVNEGKVIRTYFFDYNKVTSQTTHLNTITESSMDGSKLNPTVINWSSFSPSNSYDDDPTDDYFGSQELVCGDYNGDGRTDFFAYDATTWIIKVGSPFGALETAASGNLPVGFASAQAEDVDNDGKSDILFILTETNIIDKKNANGEVIGKDFDYNILYRNYIFNGTSLERGLASNDITFNHQSTIKIKPILSGDFNGDGKNDFLILDDYKNFLSFKGFAAYTSNLIFNYPDKVDIIDFNGDGKNDIFVVKEGNCSIYSFDNFSQSFIKIYDTGIMGYPTKWHRIFHGDFNGDGKTDLLTYATAPYNKWEINFSTGTGYVSGLTPPLKNVDPDASSVDNNFLVADFNGDGKSDILEFYLNWVNGESSTSNVNICYSLGNSFYKENNTDNKDLSWILSGKYSYDKFVDIDGDGRADILCKRPGNDNLITFHQGETPNLVVSITNGFAQKSSITYSRLSKATIYTSFYTKGSGAVFPLNDYQGPLYTAYLITVPDGIGGNSITKYEYAGAKMHRMGLGFLGFTSITVSNSSTERQVVTSNIWDNISTNNLGYVTYKLKSQTTEINSYPTVTLLSKSINNFSNIRDGNSYFTYLASNVATDVLSGLPAVTTTYSYYPDNLGNISSISKNFGSGFSENTYYNDYVSYGSYMLYKPQTIQVTRKHPDDGSSFTLKTNYTYDTRSGNITKKIDNYGTDKQVITGFSNYNAYGQAQTITTSAASEGGGLSNSKSLVFDAKGRFLQSETDAIGATTFEYDPIFGNLTKKTDSNTGLSETYSYDNWGSIKQKVNADGTVANYRTEWSNNNPDGTLYYSFAESTGRPWIKTYYDALGREKRQETIGFKNVSIYSTVSYLNSGKINEKTSYTGSKQTEKVSYTYKPNDGRVETETYLGGKVVRYDYLTTSTTTTVDGKAYQKTIDNWGNIKQCSEPSIGSPTYYTFKSSGKPATITSTGKTVTITYDNIGNQATLTDPDVGTTSAEYHYDGLDRLTYQEDANGKESRIYYDTYGRIDYKTDSENNHTTYAYYTSGTDKGRLKSITVNVSNEPSESYEYYTNGRLRKVTKHIDVTANDIVFEYAYDAAGNQTSITYPGNITVTQGYDQIGNHTSSSLGGTTFWTLNEANANLMKYTLGNGQVTTKLFDTNGMLSSIITTNGSISVQNLAYNFDAVNGNLMSRGNSDKRINEAFTYDDLNRLTDWKIYSNGTLSKAYAQRYKTNKSGNIDTKTGIGTYSYTGTRPHAISEMVPATSTSYPGAAQTITLTDFNKVSSISEGYNTLSFAYGPDQQRSKSVFTQYLTVTRTIYYGGPYEKIIENGVTKEVYYLNTLDGLTATLIKTNGDAGTLYYVHKDHLGSIVALTNTTGAIKEEMSYDPWGYRRDPATWLTYKADQILPATTLLRGFTGHEHINEMKLINMNGRVYDPLLGMFISPDPFVQDPSNSLSYNRYSYCINNPLKYTDENGYWFGIDDAIAAGLGFAVGYVSYGLTTGNWKGKAVVAGLEGAAIGWLGWNTFGAGASMASSPTFSSGMTAVFGSSGVGYGTQFAAFTAVNASMHADQLRAADKKGWDGVWAMGGYMASAVLSTSLNPASLTKVEGFRAWAGIVLTDNISDNMKDGCFLQVDIILDF